MTRLQELVCVILGHKYNQLWYLEGRYKCERCGRQTDAIRSMGEKP
jgi:hypothetical protein